MIFVDASAIVAIITREPESDEMQLKLENHARRATSGIAVYEASLAIARKQSFAVFDAYTFVRRFLKDADVELIALGDPETQAALEAFDRFGKGRHPAKLNMGDCFAYAAARAYGATLLFKGEDFSQTDIEIA